MPISNIKFFLHARVVRNAPDGQEFDDAQAGHPIERRLNRIERVAAASHGQIDLRFSDGMLILFDSANEAVLSACEMQHRCAVLPQVSRQKLTLRIGIHQGVLRQRSAETSDNVRGIAEQLARDDDSILVSLEAGRSLSKELQSLIQTRGDAIAGVSVLSIDWRREIPSITPDIGPSLQLRFGTQALDVSQDNPTVTIGRDPTSDLVLDDIHVSRNHCRIERTEQRIQLVDTSTNGTLVIGEDKRENLVKQDAFVLDGRGMIFFGRPFKGERRGGISFETR